jgi:hypothetical protein
LKKDETSQVKKQQNIQTNSQPASQPASRETKDVRSAFGMENLDEAEQKTLHHF